MLALRAQKQSLSVLLQRGSVGDDLWKRFLRAEKEMEEEVKDVVAEVSIAYAGVLRMFQISLLTILVTYRQTLTSQAGAKLSSNPPMK